MAGSKFSWTMLTDRPKVWLVLYIQSNVYRFVETSSNWSVQFVTITPASFAKTTWSYEVSLVTINRQTSYDYGIIRSLPMNLAGFAYLDHHLGSTFTETGGPNYRIGPGCAGRAITGFGIFPNIVKKCVDCKYKSNYIVMFRVTIYRNFVFFFFCCCFFFNFK